MNTGTTLPAVSIFAEDHLMGTKAFLCYEFQAPTGLEPVPESPEGSSYNLAWNTFSLRQPGETSR